MASGALGRHLAVGGGLAGRQMCATAVVRGLPGSVVVGDDDAWASLVDVFGPLEGFFGVAGDAVEEGVEHSGGAYLGVSRGSVARLAGR